VNLHRPISDAPDLRLPKLRPCSSSGICLASAEHLFCAVGTGGISFSGGAVTVAPPSGTAARGKQHDDEVLLRLAYLTVTNTFAVLRLLR
jgi:hypothetical protein